MSDFGRGLPSLLSHLFMLRMKIISEAAESTWLFVAKLGEISSRFTGAICETLSTVIGFNRETISLFRLYLLHEQFRTSL